MRLLSEYLTKRGIAHIITREPGGGEISEAIRKIILNGKFTSMTDECEALLYAAARVQHLSGAKRCSATVIFFPRWRTRAAAGD